GDIEALAREFPSVAIDTARPGPGAGERALALDAAAFRAASFDGHAADRAIDELASGGPFALHVRGARGDAMLLEAILTRFQRAIGRRNPASGGPISGPIFERVLARHRELHDLARPLVRADYDHALDTWQ